MRILKNVVLTESLMEAGLVRVSDILHICESTASEGSESFWTSDRNRMHGFANAVSYQDGSEKGGTARIACHHLILYEIPIVCNIGML